MQSIELDRYDRAILSALQRDGRLTNVELAERVNLSPSACLRRTRILENSGIVAGYALLLDQRVCGKPGNALVMVSLDQQGRQTLSKFEEAVQEIPEIMECYLLAGQADYFVHIIFEDATDFERIHTEILTQLPGVVRVQTTLSLRTVKKTTVVKL